ncbi:hypothetical protein HZS_7678 [Henneguya salminicola]|nr:hypothetical protein HZS_7678 [Henneguya salminicola]
MINICKKDRIYVFMPIYHVNSGLVIVSAAFLYGCTLVIRKKFSTTHFVDDCIKYRINCFNYIGEVCRYLCNTKPTEKDKMPNFKYIIGNGLRTNIWIEMKKRFKIDNIIEFYGSSEGNASAINLVGKVGSCGYYPIWFLRFMFFCLVDCDENGEIILNQKGHPKLSKINNTVSRLDMMDILIKKIILKKS